MQNPNNLVPANALTLSEVFELVFDAVRPDAAELRNAIGRTSIVPREDFHARFEAEKSDEAVWSGHREAWHAWYKARWEVRHFLQDALLDGALVVYQRDGATAELLRILNRNWHQFPFIPDVADESPPLFVLRSDVAQWIESVCPSSVPDAKKHTGRPRDSDYDRIELKEFIYQKMEEKGSWFQDDLPGWQSRADLQRLIRDYYARQGKKDPATSTLYRIVNPILHDWRNDHPSSSEN